MKEILLILVCTMLIAYFVIDFIVFLINLRTILKIPEEVIEEPFEEFNSDEKE